MPRISTIVCRIMMLELEQGHDVAKIGKDKAQMRLIHY